MNKDVRDKYLKFIRNRYNNKPADYDFKTVISNIDVELSNRVFLLTCDENGDHLTDKRKAEETYIKEYPSLYAETLNDIYETIGKKEIDDYTVDDLFRFLLKRYSPKILTYKDFFIKTDTLDCFLMANYYAPSHDGDDKVYPVTGNQIGAATDDLIPLPDFVFLFELPTIKHNDSPLLAVCAQRKKITGWWLGNDFAGCKKLCYALNIFQGDNGDKILRQSNPDLAPIRRTGEPYLYDYFPLKEKLTQLSQTRCDRWEFFMANYSALYTEILNDIYSSIGKKTVGEYTIEDTLKYLFEKYSPLVITQREFADHVSANDYKSYDLIETELDEPFLDFDNRVGIFELPPLSKWTTYLGADDVAVFILIAENGKLKDFWFGFNDFGYEPLKVALMIFAGYGIDFFIDNQLLPLHHHP